MADFKRILNQLRDCFTRHPQSINETYGEHFRYASVMGLRLVGAGLACVIHSLCPFWFENTASDTVNAIHAEVASRKNKLNNPPNEK